MQTQYTPHGVWEGASYLWRAVRYARETPAVLPWTVAPLLLTVGAVVAALFASVVGTPMVVEHFLGAPPGGGLAPLWWVLVLGLTVCVFVVAAVTCWFLGNLVASPFYDVLAGLVERDVLGIEDDDAFAWSRVLGDAWMSVRHSVAWFALYVLAQGLLLAVNAVPVVGSAVYVVGSAGATVWFVGQELMDVPLSRRRLSLRDKLGVLRDHRSQVAGLGGVTALALLIPLANLVVMPVAVLGASLLYCDLVRLGEEPLAQ